MSDLKNINLDVAKFAMDCVENAIEHKKDIDCGKYKTLVKKMPTLIQKNGLINTLVFVLSKCNVKKTSNKNDIVKKQFNNKVLGDIIKWNKSNEKITNLIELEEVGIDSSNYNSGECNTENVVKYIEKVAELNQVQYRLLTKEMMNLFGWIKRFADGMIEGEE